MADESDNVVLIRAYSPLGGSKVTNFHPKPAPVTRIEDAFAKKEIERAISRSKGKTPDQKL